MSSPDFPADEADVLEQQRAVTDDEGDEPLAADVEADPADVQEQSRAVPAEDDDRRG